MRAEGLCPGADFVLHPAILSPLRGGPTSNCAALVRSEAATYERHWTLSVRRHVRQARGSQAIQSRNAERGLCGVVAATGPRPDTFIQGVTFVRICMR